MCNLFSFVKNRAKCAKKHKNGKRGFTIAEAAISLALITIVTVTALTLFTTSEQAAARESAEAAALYLASDVVECFRTTDTLPAFRDAADFAGGELWGEIEPQGDFRYTMKHTRSNTVVEIRITLPEGEQETENAVISITATYNDHSVWGDAITFRKGVGA